MTLATFESYPIHVIHPIFRRNYLQSVVKIYQLPDMVLDKPTLYPMPHSSKILIVILCLKRCFTT